MSTPGSKRILIVEEHDFLRQALRRWLETMFPECQVIEATNGQQAMVTAEASLPDIILLDIYLSGMSGLETRACLKAILPTTPIVVLTGYETEAQYVQALNNETGIYVSKDRTTELRSTLAGLLSYQNNPVAH